MSRALKRRLTELWLLISVVLFGTFGWLTYAAVQRVRLQRPLVEAVKRNDVRAVKALLDAGADPRSRDVPHTPFSWQNVWESLLHRNGQDIYSPPVLQYAVLEGNGDIARMLVTRGADVNALSGYWLQTSASLDSVPSATPPAGGYTALMDAAYVHRPDLVHFLLAHHADPNIHPAGRQTPLMLALTPGVIANNADADRMQAVQTELVKMLLDYGAEAGYAVNNHGALQMAIDADWPVVRLLIEHGVDPNSTADDKWKRPLLVEAAVIEDADMIRFLVERGADTNAADNEGRTALMELCRRYEGGHLDPEAVGLLLAHGAKPNAQDKDGFTALMEAAGVGRQNGSTAGNLEAMKLLIEHGADPNLKDRTVRSALQKLRPLKSEDGYGLRVRQVLERATIRQ